MINSQRETEKKRMDRLVQYKSFPILEIGPIITGDSNNGDDWILFSALLECRKNVIIPGGAFSKVGAYCHLCLFY